LDERGRYVDSLTFGRTDRGMLFEIIGYMRGTLERWQSEGMPAEAAASDDAARAFFGLDTVPTGLRINTSACPPHRPEVLEKGPGFEIKRDAFGRTIKTLTGAAHTPQFLEWPLAGPEGWDALKGRYAHTPERFAPDWLPRCRALRAAGKPVRLTFQGFFGFPRNLMGDERLMMAYYDAADDLKRMLGDYAEMAAAVLEEMYAAGAVPDALYFWEDMAYRNGSLISPATFREFMTPRYRHLAEIARANGTPILAVDTDGKIDELVPLFVEAGVTTLYPFEAGAGMDVVDVRRRHPGLGIIGGLDKFVPQKGREAIDKELQYKLPPLVASGGYIASLDHRVPIETSFADYCYYVERAKEYLSRGVGLGR
jgi:uroporphyrinogen decarboxylase